MTRFNSIQKVLALIVSVAVAAKTKTPMVKCREWSSSDDQHQARLSPERVSQQECLLADVEGEMLKCIDCIPLGRAATKDNLQCQVA